MVLLVVLAEWLLSRRAVGDARAQRSVAQCSAAQTVGRPAWSLLPAFSAQRTRRQHFEGGLLYLGRGSGNPCTQQPATRNANVQHQRMFCRTREKCAVPSQSDSTLGSFFNRVYGATGLSATP